MSRFTLEKQWFRTKNPRTTHGGDGTTVAMRGPAVAVARRKEDLMTSRFVSLVSLLPLLAATACTGAQGGGDVPASNGPSSKTHNAPDPGGEVRDHQPDVKPWEHLNTSDTLYKGLHKADFGSHTYGGTAADSGSVQSWDSPVKNQGARPWCTAFATVGAMENLIRHDFNELVDLSEIDHWNHYQEYSVYTSVSTAATTPITPEDSWPYYGDPIPDYESTAIAKITDWKEITTKEDVFAAINVGHPVVVGVDLTDSWENPGSDGSVSSSGYIIGGHAMVVVGYQNDGAWGGGGYLTFKNSWGSEWGNLGYAKVPYSYCENIGCYFIEVQGVDYKGHTPSPAPTPGSPDAGPSDVGPAPAPAPEPTADDIDCVAEQDPSSPDRFKLHLVAKDPTYLAQVQQVTYDTHETFGDYEFWTVDDPTDGFVIPFWYRTYAHYWRTNGAVVTLKSGTKLYLAGAIIAW